MSNVKQWAVAVGLCFLSALPSCSPRIIEKVRTEYVAQEVHHRDTIITRDSAYIREWMQGDTVFVDRYRDRYVYRDRWRDSIQIKVDSFAVERVKEVQVEKSLSWGGTGQNRRVLVARPCGGRTCGVDLPETPRRIDYEDRQNDILGKDKTKWHLITN